MLDANRTVAIERLVDDLWGDDVPESAAKMVQVYVSHLRKALPAGVLHHAAARLLSRPTRRRVDLTLHELRGEGPGGARGGRRRAASARLREALDLWRGRRSRSSREPFAKVEGAHLEELRLTCLEERLEAELALAATRMRSASWRRSWPSTRCASRCTAS